ncbi:hypothetical protein O181_095470 [Austropuccinia psidii MF-1]|uniref:Uncharacterized protein n=1 Tax=Austropuccinia psidii MF-1 TaxID=1389203 RepID=A0A9Q3PC28_9BASI|nr:hypothetical protein [Austropuccinia psidii MF-1]
MKEIRGGRVILSKSSAMVLGYGKRPCLLKMTSTLSFENDMYSVEKDPYEWCLRQSKRLKAIYPQTKIQMRNHILLTQMPGEPEHAVKCRCNQNCTLDDIANYFQDVRKITNMFKHSPYKSSFFK